MKVLGIIPARGGSKGVPGKNIALLHGLPVIAYSIQAAKASRLSRTIISTDSEEIARLSLQHGGDVPFLRPAELAKDDTPTLPVLIHALDAIGEAPDAVMILQPTSPLRRGSDIDAAITMLEQNASADSVISVVPVGDHHPARMKMIRDGELIDPPFAELVEGQRRQDLSALYLRNGAIYLTRTGVLRGQKSLKGNRCLAYVMPEERSLNIDTPYDLRLADLILGDMKEGG